MRIPILGLLSIFLSVSSQATVLRVPSEYATIQACIDACVEGDTVLVAPGTYTGEGNRDLDFHGVNLSLIGEAGPEETIIDCEGEGRGIHLASGEGSGSLVQGFTITNGFVSGGSRGGAIYCNGCSPVFQDLVLLRNQAGGWQGRGGGMALEYSQVRIRRVAFIENQATGLSLIDTVYVHGGGLFSYSSSTEMDEVVFRDNVAHVLVHGYDEYCPSGTGGGADLSGGSHYITNSLFEGNIASGEGDVWPWTTKGGAIWCYSTTYIENCTFIGNQAEFYSALRGSSHAVIWKSIFAYNHESVAVGPTASPEVSCSVFWGNAELNDEYIDINDNLNTDPQFCGVLGSGNYYLQSDSPCLPDNNDCGVLIGAFGEGCEDTPVLLSSFTATQSGDAIDLRWQLGGPATEPEFRLSAEQAGVIRDLDWREDAPGSFFARDSEAIDTGSGFIMYRLEGREAVEDWQLLGSLDVEVPGANRPADLLDPFPNPFNPCVTIPVRMVSPGYVRLGVYDLAGRRVRQLVDGPLSSGRHDFTWDGRAKGGSIHSSGVYLIRLETEGSAVTKKAALIR